MEDLNLNEEKNEILGELDHLNSCIGLAKSFIESRKVKKLLTDIQNDLFVIQANFASPGDGSCLPKDITFGRIIAIQEQTYWIERKLGKLDHFILPDGTRGACFIHCARTVARQIERKLPGYLKEPTVTAQYFDRVACLLFTLARYENSKNGYKEKSPEYFAAKNPKQKERKRRSR